jgi:lysophospholipase L1-like esterase
VSVKALLKALAAAGALLLLFEAIFVFAGEHVPERLLPLPAPDGSTVILCVGDSHTQGRPDLDNYPAQLERILNERTGRHYRVLNVGVATLNTAQIRARFERFLVYYRPAIVLHWAGINNSWNPRELGVRHPGTLRRLMARSALVRRVQLALLPHRPWRETGETPVAELFDWPGPKARFRVNFAGGHEVIPIPFRGIHPSPEDLALDTRADVSAMMQMAHERGVPMYLVIYSMLGPSHRIVNDAIQAVSSEWGMPWIDAGSAARAVAAAAPGEQLFDGLLHPMPIVYREVAEQAYRLLVAEGLVSPGMPPR